MQTNFDFIVAGGGPGGTPTAQALAQAGKRVLLVEKGQGLGGTCLFEGCIPSKILRESARRLRELRRSLEFGLCLPSRDVHIDWSAIQQRKHTILAGRAQAALQKIARLKGLEVAFGTATLLGPHRARITPPEGKGFEVGFAQAVIATGSLPSRPPITGMDHPRVLDSDAILAIDHIPSHLVVIGGGPIGVELGQIFRTFGSQVTLLEAAPRILGPVDEELAERLQQRMQADGIEIHTGCRIERISHTGGGVYVEARDASGEPLHPFAEQVLLVTGRHPNVEGLGLENTQVRHTPQGIEVDSQLCTHETNIHAVGDVIGHPMFAHWATAQGLALARHLLGLPSHFPAPESNSAVIFSEPEIGMVGLTRAGAEAAGLEVEVARYDFAGDARAQIGGRATGLLKIVFERQSQRVVGIHALVEGADDLMGEAALAIQAGMPLQALAAAIHPHPTLTESFALAVRQYLAMHGPHGG